MDRKNTSQVIIKSNYKYGKENESGKYVCTVTRATTKTAKTNPNSLIECIFEIFTSFGNFLEILLCLESVLIDNKFTFETLQQCGLNL